MTARLIIVSNRLPVTVTLAGGVAEIHPSVGGLATGLRGPHERSGGLWIGWPGHTEHLAPAAAAALERQYADLRVVPIALSKEELASYYEGYSNGVLWPLLHSFPGQLPLEVHDAEAYEAVNARFADAVVERARPGDQIWIHDYQLMRVPALVRRRLPWARIGFFLHIPFPAPDIFRVLPLRERLLEGLLGADLIGFHTASYMRHFASSVLRVLGALADVDHVRWQGREVALGVFPMGIDAREWEATARTPAAEAEVAALREGGGRLLLGVDRLDYTKGIPRRLLAFERLLLRHPEWRERVRLVQVAVPSRTAVGAYQDFRGQMDALTGRINAAFATPRWTPVHYLYRGLTAGEVAALYRACDVLLVTPVRDGMNLVAKEFAAARSDGDGVLVLSEFTGAATELAEALHVNPYDLDGTAEAYHRALLMDEGERRTRMAGLRRRVLEHDVHRWVASFLERLGAPRHRPVAAAVTGSAAVRAEIARLRAARHLLLLLDYDGTLVPFAETPELASPDAALLALLTSLAALPGRAVHVVSGRTRATLERWLGHLPIGLVAEHGTWWRQPGGAWQTRAAAPPAWLAPARRILEEFAERTPGSLVEEKTAGVAWHYRMADPEYGPLQAKDLMTHLAAMLSNASAEVLLGDRVIEVRSQGVHKGTAVEPFLALAPAGSAVVAIGDDRTDEDLFAALPPGGLAVHVGPAESRATMRVADVAGVRALLAELVAPERAPRPASAQEAS